MSADRRRINRIINSWLIPEAITDEHMASRFKIIPASHVANTSESILLSAQAALCLEGDEVHCSLWSSCVQMCGASFSPEELGPSGDSTEK